MVEVLKVKNCPTCYRDIKWDDLLFYMCGHRVCSDCYPDLPHNKRCPMCNLDRPGDVPRRIFLTLDDFYVDDDREEKRNTVVDGLRKIDEATPMISVEKALGKIKRAQRKDNEDPETKEKLLRAIQDLEQKFVPTFKQFSELQERIASLEHENAQLQSSKMKYKKRISEMDVTLRNEREQTERQRQRAETYRTTVKQKDAELEVLKQAQEEKDKQIHLLKTKLKVLGKNQKRQAQMTTDADTSLQIELPTLTLDDGHERMSKRLHDLNSELRPHRTKRQKQSSNDQS
ncbi:hypothetical protein CPC08DRAFT_710138 [Agrocybe pediades]|nr:hypothetical protein CPC08DRAFT_710138 [Agrocybe pediades]